MGCKSTSNSEIIPPVRKQQFPKYVKELSHCEEEVSAFQSDCDYDFDVKKVSTSKQDSRTKKIYDIVIDFKKSGGYFTGLLKWEVTMASSNEISGIRKSRTI